MKLKVFIADDDAGMRLVLKRIMESMDGIEFIGEAADGEEAVRRCIELRPDVVFIDVEMPVLSGVEAARRLVEHLSELVLIFVTAHSEYMPEAFEVYAYDYLLKPFKTDRVRQTLRRLQKNRLVNKATPLKTLMLKNRDGMAFISVEDIILLYRENKLTYIVTAEETHSTSESLNSLQQKLVAGFFFRSHRAFIINMNFISKIYPYGRWTYLIRMKGTEKDALITHEKLEQLQDFLASR